MSVDRWSVDDSKRNEDRRAVAEVRLQAWANWSGHSSPDLIGYPSSSSFTKAMIPADEEDQAGARHVKSDITATDEECEQVDHILAGWKSTNPHWWKVVCKEYLSYGVQEVKARALGINRTFYQEQLKLLQSALWTELDSAGRKCELSGRLGSVPAKKARP